MNTFIQTIDGIQEVLAICPCCNEIYRLIEAKFIFPKKRPRKCEYLDLIAEERGLEEKDEELQILEEGFSAQIEVHRERLRELGRRSAKNRLKEIDPTFTGNQIDPQHVRVIFHPVEYIIFHGLRSEDGVDSVEFVSRSPQSRLQEKIVGSIEDTISRGDVSFETLQMKDDGSFDIRVATTSPKKRVLSR